MLYFVEAVGLDLVKVGWAKTCVRNRVHSLQVGCPVPVRVLRVIPGEPADEAAMHAFLRDYQERGEWFRLEPDVRAFIDELPNHPELYIAGVDSLNEKRNARDRARYKTPEWKAKKNAAAAAYTNARRRADPEFRARCNAHSAAYARRRYAEEKRKRALDNGS